MGFPEEFRSRKLVEQILVLDEIDKTGGAEVLPDLVTLWQHSGLDEAVAVPLAETVRALLERSEAATVEGLESPDRRFRRLCVQVAGSRRYPGALAPLLRLAGAAPEPAVLADVLSALACFDDPGVLAPARVLLRHPDPLVSSVALEVVGKRRDAASLPTLYAFVREAADGACYEVCGLPTHKAIEALASVASDEAVAFLAANLHHRGPTVRRLIHEALLSLGPRVLPHLGSALRTGDDDEKVLAANLVGMLGDRKGAALLLDAFDGGLLPHPNARFAAYEALGRLGGLASLVRLGEGLDDPDDLVLTAVVGALELLANPATVELAARRLRVGGAGASRLARVLVAARALGLVEGVYPEPVAFAPVAEALRGVHDGAAREAFCALLETLPGPRAAALAGDLRAPGTGGGGRKVLAVDDSRSMLLFYESALAALGVELSTASSGARALALLETGVEFDLILTDLNMPEMDGVEFTRKVRAGLWHAAVPIVMATTESETSQVEAARRAGVSAFLTKPMTPQGLCAAVEGLLDGAPGDG